MRLRLIPSFAALILVTVAAIPAAAQQPVQRPPQRASTPLRGYLVVGAGSSVGMPQASPTFSAEVAEHVRANLHVYLSASFSDNVMSDTAQDDLVRSGDLLSQFTGEEWVFTGNDRARSLTLGVKYLVPTASPVRPYVGGGFGVLNLRRTIRERSRGDMSEAYLLEFGAPDGAVDPSQTNTNRPLGELTVGVGIAIRRAFLDVGYRYRRGFHVGGDGLALSQVGVSAGLKF
jgi:hypothetical protein